MERGQNINIKKSLEEGVSTLMDDLEQLKASAEEVTAYLMETAK